MGNFRNLAAMLPYDFPTFATIRHARRRPKIHSQDFVFDENETNFAHVGFGQMFLNT